MYTRSSAVLRILAMLGIAATFTACATSSPIRRYSESKSAFMHGPVLMSNNFAAGDIYRIYHRGATGFVPISALRESAEERATQFCQRQGRSMQVLGEKISPPPYILGNFPRIEIVFASVPTTGDAQGGTLHGDSVARLVKLKKLRDQGVISSDEFEKEKARFLNN